MLNVKTNVHKQFLTIFIFFLLDIYDQTFDYIIYPFEVIDITDTTLQFPNDKINEVEFYYLEKTDRSDEIIFLHRFSHQSVRITRSAEENRNRQLFSDEHELPVGFRNNTNVYLFDSNLGCVHVITPVSSLKSSDPRLKDIIRKRVNIPYEQFFECDSSFTSHDSSWNEYINERFTPDRCEKPLQKQNDNDNKMLLSLAWILILITLSVVVIVFFPILIVYLAKSCEKQNKTLNNNTIIPFKVRHHTTTTTTKTNLDEARINNFSTIN